MFSKLDLNKIDEMEKIQQEFNSGYKLEDNNYKSTPEDTKCSC